MAFHGVTFVDGFMAVRTFQCLWMSYSNVALKMTCFSIDLWTVRTEMFGAGGIWC